jgi:ankyrin repeat protein
MDATELLQDSINDEDAQLAAEAIQQGADVNALWDDETMLSAAVGRANVDLVRLLLAAGADPNRRNSDGTTALTWTSNAALVEILLDGGASARSEYHKKYSKPPMVEYSSLHHAAEDGDVERLRMLLQRGDAACLLGAFMTVLSWTPLHCAANEGHYETARLLLEAGADPNLIDEDLLGYTVISLAADHDDLDMVRLLLAHGADPKLQIGLNSSALDVARRHLDKPELLQCIEEALRQS